MCKRTHRPHVAETLPAALTCTSCKKKTTTTLVGGLRFETSQTLTSACSSVAEKLSTVQLLWEPPVCLPPVCLSCLLKKPQTKPDKCRTALTNRITKNIKALENQKYLNLSLLHECSAEKHLERVCKREVSFVWQGSKGRFKSVSDGRNGECCYLNPKERNSLDLCMDSCISFTHKIKPAFL